MTFHPETPAGEAHVRTRMKFHECGDGSRKVEVPEVTVMEILGDA